MYGARIVGCWFRVVSHSYGPQKHFRIALLPMIVHSTANSFWLNVFFCVWLLHCVATPALALRILIYRRRSSTNAVDVFNHIRRSMPNARTRLMFNVVYRFDRALPMGSTCHSASSWAQYIDYYEENSTSLQTTPTGSAITPNRHCR